MSVANNDTSILSKKIWDSTFIIALFTILFYSMTFMRECSYLKFFNIPADYIEIYLELVLNLFVTNIFSIIYCASIFNVYIDESGEQGNEKSWWAIYKMPVLMTIAYGVILYVLGLYLIFYFLLIFLLIYYSKDNIFGDRFSEIKRLIALMCLLFLYLFFDVFYYFDLKKSIIRFQIVQIEEENYYIIRKYKENLILKDYKENDTLQDLIDRKEFQIKKIKDNYVFTMQPRPKEENEVKEDE